MKKIIFGIFIPLILFSAHSRLESRQYDIDYLMDLIEAGDEEGVRQFYSRPKTVKKFKHIVEFTEIFRSKLEERFGYKPSYREAYECFKANLPNMNFLKKQEKLLLSLFKEIVNQSEKAERRGKQFSDITMDYKGSADSDVNIPGELAIAYTEALGGCLMCIIPGVVSQGIGAAMIGDSARRAYNYLEKRNEQNTQNQPYDYSDRSSSTENSRNYETHDQDSWDKEF